MAIMMAPCFSSIMRSGQFTFLIGPEKSPITVHAAALAAMSKQMDVLINGSMKEAGDRCAELHDITLEDFIRICEYAYCGDYTIPMYETDDTLPDAAEPKVVSAPHQSAPGDETSEADGGFGAPYDRPIEAEVAYEEDDWAPFGRKKSRVQQPAPSKLTLFRQEFRAESYIVIEDYKKQMLKRFQPQANSTKYQNFTSIFLAYVRLYAFARLRMIENLMQLTLYKLHKTLLDFQLHDTRLQDIVELARHAYTNEHIPDRDEIGNIDALRKLVVNYMVSKYDVIGKAAVFNAFLEEGGEFVSDFWTTLSQKLL